MGFIWTFKKESTWSKFGKEKESYLANLKLIIGYEDFDDLLRIS